MKLLLKDETAGGLLMVRFQLEAADIEQELLNPAPAGPPCESGPAHRTGRLFSCKIIAYLHI